VAVAFAQALRDMGCPVTGDLSGRCQEGVAWVDLAIAGGERAGPAEGYLRPVLGRANLTVETGCLVTRLRIGRGRCTGVSYLHRGTLVEARAAREVVVCAGAVGSPQLLLLSGIGPAGELHGLGIGPVADIPAVGENLQDHPIALASYAMPSPLAVSAYNHGETYAALRSADAGACPDLHLFPILLPLSPAGHQAPETGFALVAAVVAPDSRGRVRLASANPQAAPLIDPGFLREPRDTGRLAEGLALVRQAAAGAAFDGLRQAEVWPGPSVRAPGALRAYIRRTVASYYHPAGTCRMGTGPGAVVDPQLRVHGIAGLRVADASVMPVLPNAHPHATVLAIAERAAELITGRSPARG
jgi:choline dehydrogenase